MLTGDGVQTTGAGVGTEMTICPPGPELVGPGVGCSRVCAPEKSAPPTTPGPHPVASAIARAAAPKGAERAEELTACR